MHRVPYASWLLAALLLLQACAGSQAPMQAGGLDCDGLNQLRGTGLGGVCVKDAPVEQFPAAVLEGIDYGFRPVATSSSSPPVGRAAGTRYPIGPQQKRALQGLAEQAFTDALADLQIVPVAEPGAGVLGVRGQILDVSFEVPEDPDSGAKYLFDTIGRATIFVELYDSANDELLLRAFDHRETGRLSAEDQSTESPSQMAAIADLWQAVLTEAVAYLPE